MSTRGLRIVHLYPELLNLYGDSGNILVLRRRLEWRGMRADVQEVHVGEAPSFQGADIAFIGGGSDREQRIVCESLLAARSELHAFVEDGGVLLAVCGGYQLLGERYLMGDERTHLGLGVEPLGRVAYGHGNDGESGYEGCRYKNVMGTYVHGPLLPKNPDVADWLLARALGRRYGDASLEPLDDAAELEANRVMCERLLGGAGR